MADMQTRPSGTGVLLGVAAALAAAAVANHYAARRLERRNPPRGRFVEAEGVRLHYLEKGRGDGPPVVLLHGNLVTADDFAASGLLDRIAGRHRTVAFDRPGYGHSDRPRGTAWTPAAQAGLLRAAFDRLGLDRPVVLGHSWGAMVALALALDHPEAVRGLVLLGGYFYPTMRADAALALPPAVPLLGGLIRHTVGPPLGAALLPAFVKGMFAPRPVPENFTEEVPLGLALRPRQIRAMTEDGALMIPAAAAMQDRYPELAMPVAILAGAEDKVADVGRQSERLHREVPHSTLRLVPGVGHMVHHAVPMEVAAAVESVAAGGRRVPEARLAQGA